MNYFNNLLKVFQVNKACLGLVLPIQYCLIVIRKSEAGFGDVLSCHKPLWSLLYSTIILYVPNSTVISNFI